ncbi:MAG TPA: serine--tRNA ligase [Spirochaetota bacterium]|nr:serine--tRNA ligase [Spirochaetota bacterium]HOR44797.1 serine--tRNA ligase [Spirochaetota bacterium]HPK56771.1 serine--tRNA ligase [Spirochaetota bacterium]
MIDPKVLRENPDEIKRVLKIRKMESAVDLTALSELDSKMLSLGKECDVLRESRNKLSKEVGNIKREGGDATAVMSQVNEVNSKIEKNEAEIAALNDRYNEMILSVPNILHSSVPVGNDEKDNVIVRVHGEKPAFDFAPKAHYDLGTDLDILDFERGVKLSGARFYVYKNLAAKLERAILSFMLDLHTNKHGYTEVFAPFLVNDDSMIGTGQYPKFKDEYYRMERDGLSLIPTAEVTLTNLYRDEILEGEKLPVYVTGQSSCFRREAGSAGRDTRGLIRVHQFQKVELVKFVEPETSFDELEKLVSNAEEVLKQLGLHYRVMLLCSADTSASSSKTYDIEVWMPGLDRYVEISSCSNFLDYQARRAKIRYKKSGGKAQLVHTLNGSGLAAGRTLAAVMENYQTKDGNIEIPEVLKPYMR